MSLLQAWQGFFIIIFAFAIIGFIRGWRREIVSLAFTLAAVLIGVLGGGTLVAEAIFVRLPLAFQDPKNLHVPAPPTGTEVLIVTVVTFVGIISLGYFVGNRSFPKPTLPAERILGAIPAIVAGISIYATISRLTNLFYKGSQFNVAVPNPSANTIGNYLLLIFVVLIVLLIIGLVTSSAKKSGRAKSK